MFYTIAKDICQEEVGEEELEELEEEED